MSLKIARNILFAVALYLTILPLFADFVITRDGAAQTSIGIPSPSGKLVPYAARELQDFLKRMTGVEVPIQVGGAPTAHGIRLGYRSADYAEDEYTIEVTDDGIALDGGGERGPLYAVYALLKELGCAWPKSGIEWLSVPRRAELAVPPMALRRAPAFPVRSCHIRGNQPLWRWMAFNGQNYRLQDPPGYAGAAQMRAMGVEPFFISHSFAFWVPREVRAEHPEWNPLIDGKRVPPPNDKRDAWENLQLCLGNPALRAYTIHAIRAYLDAHPEMWTVALEPSDGTGHCECDLCKAYGKTTSDQVFRWAAEVAEAIHHSHSSVRCIILSYGEHKQLPDFPLPENLTFGIVYNSRDYSRPLTADSNKLYDERLRQWAEHFPGRGYIYELWRKEFFQGWVEPYCRTFAADMKHYRDLGLAGIDPEGEHPSPAVEALRAELTWNPDADPENVVRTMCERIYGAAAHEMFDYYQLLEERNDEYGKTLDSVKTYAEFFAPIAEHAREILQTARAKASDDAAVLWRIEYERKNFERAACCSQLWHDADAVPISDTVRERNLLPNGDFEKDFQDVICDVRSGKYAFEVVHEDAYHGQCAGVIRTQAFGWSRMIMKATGLNPEKRYVVGVAIKTTDCPYLAQFWLQASGLPAELYRVAATDGKWGRLVLRGIAAPKGELSLFLTVNQYDLKGKELPQTGSFWYDDLFVVEEEDFQ